MKLERTVEPSALLTLDEAKSHLRVVHDADDTYITSLIVRAVDYIEGYFGSALALNTQTWEMSLDGFPSIITIPIWPVQSVSSVTYRDADGDSQTLTEFDADAKGNPATITPNPGASFPQTDGKFNSVTVTFVAGFTRVPGDLLQAVLLLVGHWYENREAVNVGNIINEYPLAFANILHKYAARGFA